MCSFLKDKELSLVFNDQMSIMRQVDANISQRFFISSILFLFFNISLIEKCKALKIKIKMLDFVNDINILIYKRFTEEICKTLSKTYDVCIKWAWIHDVTFALKKYEFTHFIRKSKKFDMMISMHIKSSVIKLKLNVWVLKVQLNMKLWWNAYLYQIKADHVTKMLALNYFKVFTWDVIFVKVRQMYLMIVRSEMMFEAFFLILTWFNTHYEFMQDFI